MRPLWKAERREPLDSATSVRRRTKKVYRWLGVSALWLLSCGAVNTLMNSVSPMRDFSVTERTARLEKDCPSFAYDNGDWVSKASHVTDISNDEELLSAFGYKGCRFSTEGKWEFFGHEQPRNYAGRIAPSSLEWKPHEKCHLRSATDLEKIQALVDRPLALVGDSLTRQHFFQLSCELYEHVLWTGREVPEVYEEARRWRFNNHYLVLNPASPLISRLRLPSGFNSSRPLISLITVWLPQSYQELRTALAEEYPWIEEPDPQWYSHELLKTTDDTIRDLIDPDRGIRSIVLSLGAHYSGGPHFAKGGLASNDILPIARWSLRDFLIALQTRLRHDQMVLVRASSAGLWTAGGPTPHKEVVLPPDLYNWMAMPDLMRVLEDETRLLDDGRFVWMGGDRPSRMRPDARHIDGLHLAIGTGVVESLSAYMWHWLV